MFIFFITILLFFILVSLSYKEGLVTEILSKNIQKNNNSLNIINKRVLQNRKEFYILVDEIHGKINRSQDVTSDINILNRLRNNIVEQISGTSGAEIIKNNLDTQVKNILDHIEEQNTILIEKKRNLYGGWNKGKGEYVQGIINESNLFDAANNMKVLSTNSQLVRSNIFIPILLLSLISLIFIIFKLFNKK